MKLVLLSGGSGKRLWPLSNDSRSKQFLKVLKNSEGEQVSMVQRIWGQLEKNNLAGNSIVATGHSQIDMLKKQLGPDIQIVTEPERRDTFPAIALACVYLYSQGTDLNEVVVIMPVDPYVEDGFFDKVSDLEAALRSSNANLALLGVTPSFPSEKYGYFVPNAEKRNGYTTIDYFKEKPDKEHAKRLIEKNALWNCGVFAFRLEYMIDFLKENGISVNFEELHQNYHLLPKNSFDYEVVEKADHLISLTYEGSWKDLGTWNTLTDEMAAAVTGKGIVGKGVVNSHIVNELGIPIILLGLNNIVVAASPDGILVTEKDASTEVKEYAGGFTERPMYEECIWGWYRVLEHAKYSGGNDMLVKRINITAGKNFGYHFHSKRVEVWTIVKGEGFIVQNKQITSVKAGDVISIPMEKKHALKAITNMEIIEVQTGSGLTEDDICRITGDWEEIEAICKVSI